MRRSGNWPTGAAWHRAHRYEEECGRCGRTVVKRQSMCLMIRQGPYEQPKKVCYLCHDCWAKFWEEYIL